MLKNSVLHAIAKICLYINLLSHQSDILSLHIFCGWLSLLFCLPGPPDMVVDVAPPPSPLTLTSTFSITRGSGISDSSWPSCQQGEAIGVREGHVAQNPATSWLALYSVSKWLMNMWIQINDGSVMFLDESCEEWKKAVWTMTCGWHKPTLYCLCANVTQILSAYL